MDEFVKQITDKWKEMIESIVVGEYSRKVESIKEKKIRKFRNMIMVYK